MSGKRIELDNRGLQPPQPMLRTLHALEESDQGDQVLIHNDRVPMFLIEELARLGYPYEVESMEDGSAKITIVKK
jgi:tRNA 2-thiouridine synthesizing protein A